MKVCLGTLMSEMFALWYNEAFYMNVSTSWHVFDLCLCVEVKAHGQKDSI